MLHHSCNERQKLLQYAIHYICPEAVCLDILPAITPGANPLREDFSIEHYINVIKEEEAIIALQAPSKVSKDQKAEVSLITANIGQSRNSNWSKHRIGRSTGSVAQRVHTRREETDPTSLTSATMGKCSLEDDESPPL